jgi:hypothetical protein
MSSTERFKKLAPRMMRDLMRDFAPLADFQAAGIVGNGGGESGGFTIAQEGGVRPPHGGWGGFQWTADRRRNYETFITAHGGDMHSERDALNYDFMYGMLKQELQGPEKAAILALRQTRDVSEATKMFMVKFERPGVPHYEGRVRWSQMALDAYRAEESKIATNPDIEVAKEPTKLPMPPAIPKSEADTKGATKTIAVGGGAAATLWGILGSTAFQAVLFICIAAAVWWFLIRPIVIRYTSLGEIEAGFPTKIRVALKGVKTKLFAGALSLTGIALPLVQYATDTNLLDSLPTIKGVPASIYGFGILTLIGWVTNMLRNATSTVAGQTDLALIPGSPPSVGTIDRQPSPNWSNTSKLDPIVPANEEKIRDSLTHTKKVRASRKKKAA